MQSFEHKLAEDTPSRWCSTSSRSSMPTERQRHPGADAAAQHMDSNKVLELIDPLKDVDGFHPMNVGRLSIGERAGAVHARRLDHPGEVGEARPVGLDAVVVGRSNIVGKPMAQLLLRENCTVTIAHSRTKDLPDVVRRADLVVAAIGKPEFVKGDWIKPGAIVIDVGINRIRSGRQGQARRRRRLRERREGGGAITPVPGGVGPMTIACLLKNTVRVSALMQSAA
jgi:methylenetetrahydrofolate dehydrogenase (NADP+)/methenyltetrahydrofolate cyclohydrolase